MMPTKILSLTVSFCNGKEVQNLLPKLLCHIVIATVFLCASSQTAVQQEQRQLAHLRFEHLRINQENHTQRTDLIHTSWV